MNFKSKEEIADFIKANLKELGVDAYGVDYVAEKLWDWHESELKNLRLGAVSSTLPVSSIPEFGSKEWVDCCEKMFSGKPKNG